MNKKLYNILFVARDDGGCGFFRCLQPSKFLNRAGLVNAKYVLREPTPEDLLVSDLVIMQDSGSPEASKIAQFLREHKIPFMTEYDDFIHHVSPNNHGGYPAWNPGTLFVSRSMQMTMNAIGTTVSTNQLAREYFPYNQNIYVIPNYLDQEKWDQPSIRKNDGKIRIGWCGGNAHADDLKMISKVIEKITKEYKGKVIFETMGMTKQELQGVFPMPVNDNVCESCGHEGCLHHFPGEPLDSYPLVLGSRGWDIAVAPVINNSFGNCKSDLKIKEYSAVGLPIVASPIQPYKEAAQSGAQILFAETFEEWYTCLKDLIEDKEKRTAISKNNKEWVAQYWIQNNIGKIFDVYKQIIEKAEPIFGTREQRLKKINKKI